MVVDLHRVANLIEQPDGGFLPVKEFDVCSMHESYVMRPRVFSNVEFAVRALTMILLGEHRYRVFESARFGELYLHTLGKADSYVDRVSGLDDESISCALLLANYSNAYRLESYNTSIIYESDDIYDMIRALVHLCICYYDGFNDFCFNFVGAYTDVIPAGDGEFLSNDTISCVRVNLKGMTCVDSLELLLMAIMAKESGQSRYSNVQYITCYNPLLGLLYTKNLSAISDNVVKHLRRNIIGYGR